MHDSYAVGTYYTTKNERVIEFIKMLLGFDRIWYGTLRKEIGDPKHASVKNFTARPKSQSFSSKALLQ